MLPRHFIIKKALLNGRVPDKKLKAKLDAAKEIITYTESRKQITKAETTRVEANLRQATEKILKMNNASVCSNQPEQSGKQHRQH